MQRAEHWLLPRVNRISQQPISSRAKPDFPGRSLPIANTLCLAAILAGHLQAAKPPDFGANRSATADTMKVALLR